MKALILVGLPCSGKTTWAQQHPDYFVLGHNLIREEYCKHVGITFAESFNPPASVVAGRAITRMYYARLDWAVRQNKKIIFDSTHVSVGSRERLFKRLNRYFIDAVYFDATIAFCRQANANRPDDRKIDDNIIFAMQKNLAIPTKDEGFGDVQTVVVK